MAFDDRRFAKISSCANSRLPVLWGYATNDTVKQVDTEGYFNEVSDTVQVGDVILATTINGSCSITRADTTAHDNSVDCVADDSTHDGSGDAGVWTSTGAAAGHLLVLSNTLGVVNVANTTPMTTTDTD